MHRAGPRPSDRDVLPLAEQQRDVDEQLYRYEGGIEHFVRDPEHRDRGHDGGKAVADRPVDHRGAQGYDGQPQVGRVHVPYQGWPRVHAHPYLLLSQADPGASSTRSSDLRAAQPPFAGGWGAPAPPRAGSGPGGPVGGASWGVCRRGGRVPIGVGVLGWNSAPGLPVGAIPRRAECQRAAPRARAEAAFRFSGAALRQRSQFDPLRLIVEGALGPPVSGRSEQDGVALSVDPHRDRPRVHRGERGRTTRLARFRAGSRRIAHPRGSAGYDEGCFTGSGAAERRS